MRRTTFALVLPLLLAPAACVLDDIADHGAPCTGKCDGNGELPRWGVNDVSILYPAPTTYTDAEQLLGMQPVTDDGRTVTLLPEALFARLGSEVAFLTETPNRDQHYAKLRVTAVRFDPCLEQRVPDPHCRRAVRIVAQPIWPIGDTADIYDASIHMFYVLDDDAFSRLLVGYNGLLGRERLGQALYVHPVLAREGVDGPFARGLARELLAHIGEHNLVRMTFMATGRSGNNWFWGAFDRDASGQFVLATIPTLDVQEDSFTIPNRPEPPTNLATDPFPEALLWDSLVDQMSEAELRAAAEKIYRIENPALVDSTNIRCSGCHLAGRSLDRAFKRRGMALPDDPGYVAPPGQNLELRDETRYEQASMHGFSYFRDAAAISRRVVKESATIADFLVNGTFAATLSPSARALWDASEASRP